MADYVDATFYAQVEPRWYSDWRMRDGKEPDGAAVLRISARAPRRPIGGTITVKLTIRIPAAAFMPLRPEAIVVVPESMTEANPIIVEALDPTGDGDD